LIILVAEVTSTWQQRADVKKVPLIHIGFGLLAMSSQGKIHS